MVDFLLVNQSSAYNAIIGRPTLNVFQAVVSAYHLAMKFLAGDLVGEVRGDQAKSRQCYAMSTKVVGKHKSINTVFHLEDVEIPLAPNSISHTLGELDPREREREREKRGGLVKELESIKLDDQHPKHTVQVGSQLSGCLRDQLISFLKEHIDVLAWSHENMPGIDPDIIAHRLNVDPTHKPVIQKRRRFNPERYTVINKEVEKLLASKFIWEVHYPEWLEM